MCACVRFEEGMGVGVGICAFRVRANEPTRLPTPLAPGVTSEWAGYINKHSKNQHLEERWYIRCGTLNPSLCRPWMWSRSLIMTPIFISFCVFSDSDVRCAVVCLGRLNN